MSINFAVKTFGKECFIYHPCIVTEITEYILLKDSKQIQFWAETKHKDTSALKKCFYGSEEQLKKVGVGVYTIRNT